LLRIIFKTGRAIPVAGRSENPEVLESAHQRMHGVLAAGDVLGIFPEGRITEDGEIQPFRTGIEKVVSAQPVPVVPIALCNLWGSLFSRRDPLHKRRPYKLWARIEMRIGEPIPPGEFSAARLETEIRRLRGPDR
jgi:1-acyl-sn-glycerol-3-phosphate acyltransferase